MSARCKHGMLAGQCGLCAPRPDEMQSHYDFSKGFHRHRSVETLKREERPMEAEKKVCKKCGEPKILDDFPKSPNTKDGREGKCKECKNKANKIKRMAAAKAEGRTPRSRAKLVDVVLPPKSKGSAASPQPDPRGAGDVVLGLVLKDLIDRSEMGRSKYGTLLRTGNGRDALWDAYQEVLDLAMYLRQELREQWETCDAPPAGRKDA